jgi:transcriptional regulator GlxA family with amidase domain
MMNRRALVFVFPGCELLDFAGPVQALHEAGERGGPKFDVVYCGHEKTVKTAQGMTLSDISPLPALRADDWIIIPGYTVDGRKHCSPSTKAWLEQAVALGARVCSVCTGAFLLGEAGLLRDKRCTTHWRRVQQLQQQYPTAKVLGDRLYVEDGSIVTSAGIAAGIDMTLWLLERDYGPALAADVAREMVVYLRRDGNQRQESIYLDYQTHLNPGVHSVQYFLAREPGSTDSLAALAHRFGMSERNLSRAFRTATGLSVHQYRTRVRLEHAMALLPNPELTMEAIATRCGFADARQLRRLLNQQRRSDHEPLRNAVAQSSRPTSRARSTTGRQS